jgi:flagellar hook assembly protein FlgD
VEAEVFDVSGRRVRVLYRGLMEGGAQTLSWDGRDQRGNPSGPGVYLVRVRNGNKEETIKTVRVR